MRATIGKLFLAAIPLTGLLVYPSFCVAFEGDQRWGYFSATVADNSGNLPSLFSGEFLRVHGSYYPERRIDRRERLFGGRHYYDKGHYRHGWRRPAWGYGGHGDGYRGRGWHCPPRYDRNDYYRHRRPW